MENLTLYGWLDGITAATIVLFGTIAATYIYFKAKKINARMLQHGSIMSFCSTLLWLGPTVDFITILITGENLNNEFGLYGLLSYVWVGPATVAAMYLGAEILIPDKKKTIVIIYCIIGIIFELFLFLDTMNTFVFNDIERAKYDPGTILIDTKFNYLHPTFLIIALLQVSLFSLNVVGSMYQAVKTTGIVRKKFLAQGATFLIFIVVALTDSMLSAGPLLFIFRGFMVFGAVLMYTALKP